MRIRHRTWMLAVLAAAACDAGPYEPDGPFLGLQAETYLTSALDIMENNSIRKHEIEWPAFREIALDSAYQAAAIDPVLCRPRVAPGLKGNSEPHRSACNGHSAQAVRGLAVAASSHRWPSSPGHRMW